VPTLAQEKRQTNLLPLVIVLVLAAICGAAVWFFFIRAEAKAYVRNLALAEVEMKAKENMIGGTLVEITGKLTNKGMRTLQTVEINCIFYDPSGQAVLRERVPIVRFRGGAGLEPGATRGFRLPFDSIPPGWNQALPQLVIAGIEFQN
jgi:flagellar basal body-associated protein FliL